jgi:hypothetical protein
MKHTGCLHFITLMNLLYLPTSVNCPQDIISHIQVVHRLQVKSMHSLIRVWFLNPFRLPSSQCEAYSQHLYKCQCCFVVDCILQILFSSYPISLSFNQSLVYGQRMKKNRNSRTGFRFFSCHRMQDKLSLAGSLCESSISDKR